MKKWKSIAATAAALSLMFTAVPIHAEEQLSQSVEQNGQTAPNIDQAVSDKLTDALNKLAPNSKITFTSVDENLWVFEGTLSGKTEASFSQLYNPEKNRVESTSIIYKADDMDKVMDKTLSSRVTSFLKTFDTDKNSNPKRSGGPTPRTKRINSCAITGYFSAMPKTCTSTWTITMPLKQVFPIL